MKDGRVLLYNLMDTDLLELTGNCRCTRLPTVTTRITRIHNSSSVCKSLWTWLLMEVVVGERIVLLEIHYCNWLAPCF